MGHQISRSYYVKEKTYIQFNNRNGIWMVDRIIQFSNRERITTDPELMSLQVIDRNGVVHNYDIDEFPTIVFAINDLIFEEDY